MIGGTLTSVLLLTSYRLISIAGNPHIPYTLTWEVSNWETHEVYNSTTKTDVPLNTWWPDLYFNLEQMAKSVGLDHGRGKETRNFLSETGFYACPGFGQKARSICGGILSYYCKSWSCVTANDGKSKWKVTPLYIDMSFVKPCDIGFSGRGYYSENCNLVRIKYLEDGKKETRWTNGLTWGIYLYRGPPHYATVIQIKLKVEPKIPPVLVGPNLVVRATSEPTTRATSEPTTTTPGPTSKPTNTTGKGPSSSAT